ncbi:hypothetical protein MTO96_019747 [Rhipicephalus appendiculatus]
MSTRRRKSITGKFFETWWPQAFPKYRALWCTNFWQPMCGLECSMALLRTMRAFQNFEPWILRLFDATGKYPTGFLEASRVDMGAFDECLETTVRDRNGSPTSANMALFQTTLLLDWHYAILMIVTNTTYRLWLTQHECKACWKAQRKWQNMIIAAGFNGVDTFCFLSGLFLHHNISKQKENWAAVFIIAMIRRWIRLCAPLFFVIMCFYLLPRFVDGPDTETFFQRFYADVSEHWWMLLFQIRNFFKMKYVLNHLWYLSADFQLFLVSLLTLLTFRRQKYLALAALATLSLLGCAIATWTMARLHLLPFIIIPFPNFKRMLSTVSDYYIQPFYHAVCYFSGCMTSLIIADFRERKISKLSTRTGKYPSGLLEGSRVDMGAFDECLDTVVRDRSGNVMSRGQYCLAFQVAKGFSVKSNTRYLLNVASKDQAEQHSLQFLHGIRCLATMHILIGHINIITTDSCTRVLSMFEVTTNWSSMVISAAVNSVDTFFFLSGFFLCHIISKQQGNRAAVFIITVTRRLIRRMNETINAYYAKPFYHAVCHFSGCMTCLYMADFRERRISKATLCAGVFVWSVVLSYLAFIACEGPTGVLDRLAFGRLMGRASNRRQERPEELKGGDLKTTNGRREGNELLLS